LSKLVELFSREKVIVTPRASVATASQRS
jgi:hypothetical protein